MVTFRDANEYMARWDEDSDRVEKIREELKNPTPVLNEGVKYDQEKLRYDLIPALPLKELARVYTVGAAKYADHNWRKGMEWHRIIAALLRHLEQWRLGETIDKESKCHHLASVAWCALTLIEYELLGIGQDDRASYGANHSTNTRMGE